MANGMARHGTQYGGAGSAAMLWRGVPARRSRLECQDAPEQPLCCVWHADVFVDGVFGLAVCLGVASFPLICFVHIVLPTLFSLLILLFSSLLVFVLQLCFPFLQLSVP